MHETKTCGIACPLTTIMIQEHFASETHLLYLAVLDFRGRFPPDLECSVCLKKYRDGGKHARRLLLCKHTVCNSCLREIVKNETLKCPECRCEQKGKTVRGGFFELTTIVGQRGKGVLL